MRFLTRLMTSLALVVAVVSVMPQDAHAMSKEYIGCPESMEVSIMSDAGAQPVYDGGASDMWNDKGGWNGGINMGYYVGAGVKIGTGMFSDTYSFTVVDIMSGRTRTGTFEVSTLDCFISDMIGAFTGMGQVNLGNIQFSQY